LSDSGAIWSFTIARRMILRKSNDAIKTFSDLYDRSNNENYMVLFNGNAEVVGNFRALNFYKASDINIKEDIRLLEEDRDCRASLLQLIDGTFT
jgi:hypothetical protein